MAATARAVEQRLDGISAHGDGTWDWQFSVYFLNLGGSYGSGYQQSVIVNSASNTALPTTTARASAYRSHGNGLSEADNTLASLLSVDLITWLTV